MRSEVEGLGLDMTSKTPVLVLKPFDKEDRRILVIWIGPFEASSISTILMGLTGRRPSTYDLLLSAINRCGAGLDRISITELKDETYYAKLHLVMGDLKLDVDARPSDAVALALKAGVHIFIESVLFKADDSPAEEEPQRRQPESPDALKERLRQIDPEDLGRFHMQ